MLSPGLFSPKSSPKNVLFSTKISPRNSPKNEPFSPSFANTPGGKRLQKRLNDLMTTLGTYKTPDNSSILNISDGDELSNLSQPDFSGIDF